MEIFYEQWGGVTFGSVETRVFVSRVELRTNPQTDTRPALPP